jgi:hypothetical protein
MRSKQTLRAVVVAAVVGMAGAALLYASRSEGAAPKLTGGDIAEIQNLYAVYNQGWDFRDVELYLSAYADDGVFTTGAGEAFKGKTALREYLTTAFKQGVNGHATHNNTSVLITPTPEGAKGRAYWYVVNVLAQPPVFLGTGHYNDTFVKTRDGWKFKSRTSVRGWKQR